MALSMAHLLAWRGTPEVVGLHGSHIGFILLVWNYLLLLWGSTGRHDSLFDRERLAREFQRLCWGRGCVANVTLVDWARGGYCLLLSQQVKDPQENQ